MHLESLFLEALDVIDFDLIFDCGLLILFDYFFAVFMLIFKPYTLLTTNFFFINIS